MKKSRIPRSQRIRARDGELGVFGEERVRDVFKSAKVSTGLAA